MVYTNTLISLECSRRQNRLRLFQSRTPQEDQHCKKPRTSFMGEKTSRTKHGSELFMLDHSISPFDERVVSTPVKDISNRMRPLSLVRAKAKFLQKKTAAKSHQKAAVPDFSTRSLPTTLSRAIIYFTNRPSSVLKTVDVEENLSLCLSLDKPYSSNRIDDAFCRVLNECEPETLLELRRKREVSPIVCYESDDEEDNFLKYESLSDSPDDMMLKFKHEERLHGNNNFLSHHIARRHSFHSKNNFVNSQNHHLDYTLHLAAAGFKNESFHLTSTGTYNNGFSQGIPTGAATVF